MLLSIVDVGQLLARKRHSIAQYDHMYVSFIFFSYYFSFFLFFSQTHFHTYKHFCWMIRVILLFTKAQTAKFQLLSQLYFLCRKIYIYKFSVEHYECTFAVSLSFFLLLLRLAPKRFFFWRNKCKNLKLNNKSITIFNCSVWHTPCYIYENVQMGYTRTYILFIRFRECVCRARYVFTEFHDGNFHFLKSF